MRMRDVACTGFPSWPHPRDSPVPPKTAPRLAGRVLNSSFFNRTADVVIVVDELLELPSRVLKELASSTRCLRLEDDVEMSQRYC